MKSQSRFVSEQQIMKAGDILLYSPFKTVWWCLSRCILPSLKIWFDCLCGLAILVVTWSQYTHVVQCLGNDRFVHTRMGKVRCDKAKDFHPGYLETVKSVSPPYYPAELIEQAFLDQVGKKNIDPTTIPLGAPFRWLYKLGCIKRDFRYKYKYVNCTAFIAKTWNDATEGRVDWARNANTCWVGIYPCDFILASLN